MSDPIVFGFPRSTFVNIVRLVLTHKEVPYKFQDLEPEMGKPSHLALHPFNRVPILQHGDFTVYETSAIVAYVDETFPRPPLQPRSIPDRARMDQWISAVNSYYYPYMIYHVTHERNWSSLILGSHPTRRWWRMRCRKSRLACRCWSAQLGARERLLC